MNTQAAQAEAGLQDIRKQVEKQQEQASNDTKQQIEQVVANPYTSSIYWLRLYISNSYEDDRLRWSWRNRNRRGGSRCRNLRVR